MTIFLPKPWVNPFGKMSIFRILELLVFIAYKGAFSFEVIVKSQESQAKKSQERRFIVLEYRKSHFLNQYCLKKKGWKNRHIWTKTMG